jgi:signal peptidase
MKDADFAKLSREILERGDSIRFKAHGSSMFPLIRDGDLLTIRPLEIWNVKPGDVIFYQTIGEKCITHRVIKIEIQNDQQIIITRGDASPRSEEPIQREQVLGKVVIIHRGNKQLNLGRNLWWLLSRHLPGFLHLMYLTVRVHKNIQRNPIF